MAIQKTISFTLNYALTTGGIQGADYSISKNLTVEEAYIKISDVYNVRSSSAIISLNVYKSDKITIVATKMYAGFSPKNTDNSANIIKQAYRWLLTQSDFLGATSILEEGQTV